MGSYIYRCVECNQKSNQSQKIKHRVWCSSRSKILSLSYQVGNPDDFSRKNIVVTENSPSSPPSVFLDPSDT